MRGGFRFFAGIVVWQLTLSLLWGDLQVAPVFSDHMVIQRGRPIVVWGRAEVGQDVVVSWGSARSSGRTGSDGSWMVELPGAGAGGPHDLVVSAGGEVRTFADVVLGDVWLLSGQSNMVLALQATTEWPEVKTAGVFPNIRICKLPGNHSFEPAEGFPREISWQVLNSAKAGFFSGVGYHFGRTLQPKIGVPLGLIQASAGGTQIEQWIPEAALKARHPDSRLFAERDKALAVREADPEAKISSIQAGAATLYNGSIHPLRHLGLAGVLWYQGEANARTKADYRSLLATWVSAWREVFGRSDLPFVVIQLPNFGLPKNDSWMRLREAQMLAARELDLALVVTIDQGAADTIHPPNKAAVGRRAGLAALQHVYHLPVEGRSPRPETVHFDGGAARVEFSAADGQLMAGTDGLAGFEVAGEDRVFYPAEGKVEGRVVVVRSEEVKRPEAVRYLWASAPEKVGLFSVGGLPVSPFRSDAWPEGGLSPWFHPENQRAVKED